MEKNDTQISKENLILFDWLTVTSKIDSPESLMELLGLSHVAWQKMEKGRNGYRQRLFFENISILYDGAENMGVCLDITGSGCRALETYSTEPNPWESIFTWIYMNGDDYNITRLDMAYDDYTGILDIEQIHDDTDDHHYVSRFRGKSKWKVEYGSAGTTVYHGSPKSNMYIRIYDKGAQQDLDDVHWIRVEMQMRDEIAKGFVWGLTGNSVGDQFRGVLHNYLRYVVPVEDTNMSRWPLADYWAELLQDVQRIRVWSTPGVDYTEWHLHNYIINQTGNALDCYLSIFGVEDLIRELGKRSIRISPKYERLKAKYEALKQRRQQPDES